MSRTKRLWLLLPACVVGDEILYPFKARDVVDLIEDNQAEDSADTRNGAKAEIGIRIMFFGYQGYFMFNTVKQLIVMVNEAEVKFLRKRFYK